MVDVNDIPPPLPAPAGYVPNPATTGEREAPPADGPLCQNCGAGPARHATFHQNTGMLFSRSMRTLDGTFCRSCGLALGRVTANRSLWTGWWGVISFFVNIGYVLGNAGTLIRHGTLGTPRGGQGTLDPGRPMLLRSGVFVLAAIVAIGIGLVNSSSQHSTASDSSSGYEAPNYVAPTEDLSSSPTSPPVITAPPVATWQMGACVSVSGVTAEPVPCSDPHEGTVVSVTSNEAACPPATDGTVTNAGSIYCVDTG